MTFLVLTAIYAVGDRALVATSWSRKRVSEEKESQFMS